MKCKCCDNENDVRNHLIVGPETKSVEIPLCPEHRTQADSAVLMCALAGNSSKEQVKKYKFCEERRHSFAGLLETVGDIGRK